MKELIKEAENLYKQIDKAQVHLINTRLNNDEEGKKSAISEIETAMCNTMQLLKCFIDRKDNIVDLGEVWHTLDLNASVPDSNIAYLDIIAIVDNKIVRRVNCLASLYRWLRTNAGEHQSCNDRRYYTREAYIKPKRKRKIESVYDYE